MAVDLLDYTSFDEMGLVGELGKIDVRTIVGNWSGSATSLQLGWNGSGQCVRGPSNLAFNISGSSYPSLGVRGRIKIRTLGVAQNLVSFVSGINQQGDFSLDSSNFLKLNNVSATGSGDFTSTTSVQQDVWYEFEFAWHLNNSTGAWRVVWNNAEIADLTATGQDTIYSAASVLDKVLFHNANIDIDDVVIWGSTTLFTNGDFYSVPGQSVSVLTLKPNAVGSYSGWTNQTNTGTEDYEEVDEATHDAGTSYIHANASPQREAFGIETWPGAVEVFQFHAMRTQISNANLFASPQGKSFIRYSGVDYDGATGGSAGETSGNGVGWVSTWFRVDIWKNMPGTFNPIRNEDPVDVIAMLNALEIGFNQTGSTSALTAVSQATLQVLYVTGDAPEPSSSSASIVAFKNSHRLVKTWLIERTDGVIFAFTDHDRTLILDGVTFEPVHSLSGAAIRRELMLKDQNTEYIGAVSSEAVTVEDLLAGRYRDATITERVVDWKYPWAGDAIRNIYTTGEIQQDGRIFRAGTTGLPQLLQRRVGLVVGRVCRWKLYGPGCLVNPASFTYSGVDVAAVVSRREFQGSGIDIPLLADDYFNLGEVLWITGDNAGITSEVLDYAGSTRNITLYLPLPFGIQVGDTFTIRKGCDGLVSTCKGDFDNFDNFGAEPFIPGRNRTFPQV